MLSKRVKIRVGSLPWKLDTVFLWFARLLDLVNAIEWLHTHLTLPTGIAILAGISVMLMVVGLGRIICDHKKLSLKSGVRRPRLNRKRQSRKSAKV